MRNIFRKKPGVKDIVKRFERIFKLMLEINADKAEQEIEMDNGIVIKVTIEIDDTEWKENEK